MDTWCTGYPMTTKRLWTRPKSNGAGFVLQLRCIIERLQIVDFSKFIVLFCLFVSFILFTCFLYFPPFFSWLPFIFCIFVLSIVRTLVWKVQNSKTFNNDVILVPWIYSRHHSHLFLFIAFIWRFLHHLQLHKNSFKDGKKGHIQFRVLIWFSFATLLHDCLYHIKSVNRKSVLDYNHGKAARNY